MDSTDSHAHNNDELGLALFENIAEVHAMQTIDEIQRALKRLTVSDRLAVGRWLQELDHVEAPGDAVAEPAAKYGAVELPVARNS